MKHLTQLAVILFVSVFALPLAAQQWTQLPGTDGQYIGRINCPADSPKMLIATSSKDSVDLEQYSPFSTYLTGNGVIYSNDAGNSFSRCLDSVLVFDVIKSQKNPNRWYATVRFQDHGGVLVSEDNGQTWDIGDVKCETYSTQKYALAESPFNPNYVAVSMLASDEGYNYSDDNFTTCHTLADFDIQSRSISFSKTVPGLVYIAGDASFADGVYHSIDSGKTWKKYSYGLENLRVLAVEASSFAPGLVFAGVDTVYDFEDKMYMGRGIYVSQDTGKTWMSIGAKNSRVFDIKECPSHPYFVAAACNSEGVYVSSAKGFYWERRAEGLPEGVEVRSVAVPNADPVDNGFVCYAGTQGKGIYKSVPLLTGVEENPNIADISIYPQPCTSKISISWNNKTASNCKLEIRDILGNVLLSQPQVYCNEGMATMSIENLDNKIPSSGTYFITITSADKTFSRQFIKL